jgi:hypothetical protein
MPKSYGSVHPKGTLMKFLRMSLATIVAFAFSSAHAAGGDSWEFAITPYLWLPSVHGTLNFDVPPGGNSPIAEFGPSDYLSNLKFAAMLTGTARKGDWGIFYDVVYVHFADLRSTVRDLNGPGGIISLPVSASVDSSLEGAVATLTGTYTVVDSSRLQLDLIGGVRYANISTSASWNFAGPNGALASSGSVSKSIDFVDGIFGTLGHVQLGDSGRWYLPFELDFGAGSNNSTTANAVLGVGYNFGWGGLTLAYRYLYYDLGSNGPLHDVKLAGPTLGATFRW